MVTYDPSIGTTAEDPAPEDAPHDAPDDAVFRALADPHRRVLLDALFGADGQTLGRLCRALPHMTRFGVMKHLGVLEDAGLVVTARAGRTKLHYLNPVPIHEIHERWISKYARAPVGALVDLRARLEHEPGARS